MFASAKRVKRGECSCCGTLKSEDIKLYILDIQDSDMPLTPFIPKLKEADSDFAACLKCWKFIGGYISNHVRVQSYV